MIHMIPLLVSSNEKLMVWRETTLLILLKACFDKIMALGAKTKDSKIRSTNSCKLQSTNDTELVQQRHDEIEGLCDNFKLKWN